MKFYFFLIIILFPLFLFGQETRLENLEQEYHNKELALDSLGELLEELKLEKIQSDLDTYGLPEYKKTDSIIWHSAMAILYNETHEQAQWVAHILLSDVTHGSVTRTNDFRQDTLVTTGTAVEEDYFLKTKLPDGKYEYDGYGYDRGHLAPSADFRWSRTALSESYFYSNMSPQLPEFNRDKWASLENFIRAYMYRYPNSQLYIVTGPVLHDGLAKSERSVNNISIPEQYFKLAMDYEAKRGIAFLVPHKAFEYPVESYAISIDSLEKITGINFYSKLNATDESKIESEIDIALWMPETSKNDCLPMKANELPKKCWNTVEAKLFVDKGEKITVCGTVVGSHKSDKGNIFLNLDKAYPNQIFSLTIWNRNKINFSYQPEVFLMNKKICVSGIVKMYQGIPGIYLDNEKKIRILD